MRCRGASHCQHHPKENCFVNYHTIATHAPRQGRDGNFYGTTSNGGATEGNTYNNGTVYSITPSGTLTNLYSFSGGADGTSPLCALVEGANGDLYGTTDTGGTTASGAVAFGTVFRLNVPQLAAPQSWTAVSNATGPDGQTRILWDRADGAITLWTLAADNSVAANTGVIGPYAGWTAKAISVDPQNNTHILWTNTDGRMTLWTMNSSGAFVGSYPVFGPYTGWDAKSISVSPDGNTYILWDTADGSIAPWTLDTNNRQIGRFPVYGAYTDWTAKSISVGPDGSSHILWDNEDGRIAPWTLDGSYNQTGKFPVYGPYRYSVPQ